MEQLEFFDIPSPCIRVCEADEKGYCRGCMRNRDERLRWLKMAPAEKLHVIKLCKMRYRRKMAKKHASGETEDIAPESPQRDLF
ncbi:DUF1289 domain-containing protein [Vibrio mangrovi]|uniref:DUF1289 domain-containing protein n=1 Tax=Vibrio mangrovi TaxID=474394 RepID=A0A1Y6INX6_9VIBR|nr:DUF1289 domain-containing protein [Vibrio mangrovi]MDW6003841.1 DUF1289 domain-containing protein [Vibrio mangrovi]SMR99364.1 hypothetical protein VIM7927_00589 [Vibrio mangrovi]